MSNTKTVIELNGKRYDALTGKLLDVSPAPAHTKPQRQHTGVNMDGFIKKPSAHKSAPKRPTSKPVHHHKPQQAKTLMRHVVKKPAASPTPAKKVAASTTTPQPVTLTHPNALFVQRDKRAHSISKSPLISRFGSPVQSHQVTKKITNLEVRPAPSHGHHHAASHTAQSHSQSSDKTHFSKALANATSHTQPKIKKSRAHHRAAKKLGVSTKAFSVSAAALAVIMLGGFIAYQNVPNVAMRVASSKAGFNAQMPGYVPSGFAMNGKIQAKSGVVTIAFKSSTDDRRFEVTQQPSNWTSQSLADNYLASATSDYQTYEDKGRTIYLYGGSNATWVNGGVWYKIEGNSNLNSDQVLNIANSL